MRQLGESQSKAHRAVGEGEGRGRATHEGGDELYCHRADVQWAPLRRLSLAGGAGSLPLLRWGPFAPNASLDTRARERERESVNRSRLLSRLLCTLAGRRLLCASGAFELSFELSEHLRRLS